MRWKTNETKETTDDEDAREGTRGTWKDFAWSYRRVVILLSVGRGGGAILCWSEEDVRSGATGLLACSMAWEVFAVGRDVAKVQKKASGFPLAVGRWKVSDETEAGCDV
ncbi:uncharacterized protein SPSK_04664 [Sporothrix schenckii 1099-18]|uniref:Uncharacterized protein n=1 Tax=Sporothrix schenckii 1099-18 TaxID=1397361 RepID=A0A0F2M2X8_SPOSC|nr:uncharacterized protein SPSK_04664 [Sporothrix schenckii 1099-18]KJR83449.1 hypothetical protein SPSK_04664 [Sporothrix schenckii 1099-18]